MQFAIGKADGRANGIADSRRANPDACAYRTAAASCFTYSDPSDDCSTHGCADSTYANPSNADIYQNTNYRSNQTNGED